MEEETPGTLKWRAEKCRSRRPLSSTSVNLLLLSRSIGYRHDKSFQLAKIFLMFQKKFYAVISVFLFESHDADGEYAKKEPTLPVCVDSDRGGWADWIILCPLQLLLAASKTLASQLREKIPYVFWRSNNGNTFGQRTDENRCLKPTCANREVFHK